jgi:hypothetical protein
VGVELFHADGQTDMTKLIVAFRNFANAFKNAQLFGTTLAQNYKTTLFHLLKASGYYTYHRV